MTAGDKRPDPGLKSFFDFRFAHLDWRAEHLNLARLQDKLVQRPSFSETAHN